MTKLITLLALIAAPSAPAVAAEAQPWAAFEQLRQGTPPRLSAGVEFTTAKRDFTAALRSFGELYVRQSITKDQTCAEFSKVTRRTLRSLAQTMDHFKDPSWDATDREALLARGRMLLMIPSLQVLQRLFARGRDGGYGTIDLRATQTCAFRDRARVDVAFADLAARAEAFREAALGSPGVLPLERLVDGLLRLAEAKQARFDRLTWVVMGGTLVTTVLLWELGAFPALLTRVGIKGGWQYAVGLALLGGAENLTYEGISLVANPEPAQRRRPQIPTWSENMRDVNALVSSSFDEPQVYLAYLSVVQAQRAAMIGAWVEANQAALNQLVPQ